jgi:FAD/FMN-containing dehydrogenase
VALEHTIPVDAGLARIVADWRVRTQTVSLGTRATTRGGDGSGRFRGERRYTPGDVGQDVVRFATPSASCARRGADKYNRLRELKRKYDPDNFFRLNQNISPATR